jgi:hypothetical protein
MEERRRAEEAYTKIRAGLGAEPAPEAPAEGVPGAAPPAPGAAPPSLYEESGILGAAKMMPGAADIMGFGKKGWKAKAPRRLLDPEAVAAAAKGTPEYEIMSHLTRQAGQFVKGEGELYDKLQQSVISPIIEGSAMLLKQQAEQVRRNFARGGVRRAQAREDIINMQLQEAANLQKTHQVWNATTALKQWGINYANTQVTEYNKAFAENVGGVRDRTLTALEDIGRWYVGTAIPKASALSTEAININRSIKAAEDASKGRMLKIAGGIAAAVGGALVPGASFLVAPGLQAAAGGLFGEETAGQFLGGAAGEQAAGIFEPLAKKGASTIADLIGFDAPSAWETGEKAAQRVQPIMEGGLMTGAKVGTGLFDFATKLF